MIFSFRKKRTNPDDTIKAIHKTTFERIDSATSSINDSYDSMDRLNQALDDGTLDLAGKIFLATGGAKRIKQ